MGWQMVDLADDPHQPRFAEDPQLLVEELLFLADRRPSWWADAACRGKGVGLFFPELGESTAEAKAFCCSCPVVDNCLVAGMDERSGIWGGTSEGQRRTARRSAA